MTLVRRIAPAVLASSVLYGAAFWLAPVATVLMVLVPLPVLVLATAAPMVACVVWLVLTGVTITAGLGTDAAIGFLVPFGLCGVALAYGVRKGWSFERTALAGIGAWSLGLAVGGVVAFQNWGLLVAAAREQLLRSLELAASSSSAIGSDNPWAATDAERQALVTAFVEMLPAAVVLTGALTVLINLGLLRSWTVSHGDGGLRMWRTPTWLIWGLITSGFAMFLPHTIAPVAARNVFAVVLGCYFCQGLAIVSFYLERFRLPRGVRLLAYVLIAAQHLIAALVLLAGVFDLWVNFRGPGAGAADLGAHPDSD